MCAWRLAAGGSAAQEGMDLQGSADKVQGGLNGFRWQHTFGSIAYVTVHHGEFEHNWAFR
jgi:hypothetical protein